MPLSTNTATGVLDCSGSYASTLLCNWRGWHNVDDCRRALCEIRRPACFLFSAHPQQEEDIVMILHAHKLPCFSCIPSATLLQ